MLQPKMVVLDEPLSALDMSVQAQIASLLISLREDLDIAYILISHDLAVVRSLADRVAVMYLGRIVESADARQIFARPNHPYTQALMSAAPRIEEGRAFLDSRIRLLGDPPSPTDVPTGCRFRTRCHLAESVCEVDEPVLSPRLEADHDVACHFPQEGTPWSLSTPAPPSPMSSRPGSPADLKVPRP
jgi:oligopeptide/dipeptide ABC transporter ATP-binding protein